MRAIKPTVTYEICLYYQFQSNYKFWYYTINRHIRISDLVTMTEEAKSKSTLFASKDEALLEAGETVEQIRVEDAKERQP